jgi:hypothetical protein
MNQEIIDRYTIAYTLYLKYCKKGKYGIVPFEQFNKNIYYEFFEKADVILRNQKINKILNNE